METVLALSGNAKRIAKVELLQEVLDWSRGNVADATAEWAESAKEQIELLQQIGAKLDMKSSMA